MPGFDSNTPSLEIIKQYHILPLSEDTLTITLGVTQNFDREKQESLEFIFGKRIKTIIVDENLIQSTLDQYSLPPPLPLNNIKEQNNEQNIEQKVTDIINKAISQGTSDIHWERHEEEDLLIRYRIDGQLHKVDLQDPSFSGLKIISHLKIMAHLNIDEKRLPQDGRFHWSYNDKKYDLRVSSLPTIHGENLATRILDRKDLNLNIQELGFQPKEWETLEALLKKPNGLLLVTGPTGSGKTTTLYSALNYRSQFNEKIITVEDPIEYEFDHFAQIPVRSQIGMTFANALRAILRQSPNTIMIGEIRDTETAQIAINAALTGHLVLSTLHTNDAISAIYRLKDLGLEIYQIASVLQGVISQKLIRKLCEFCKQAYKPTHEELSSLNFLEQEIDQKVFYKANGCKHCHNSGFKGRLALFEILPITQKLKELINLTLNPQDLKNHTATLSLSTLKENGKQKILQGLTTIEEILANIIPF